VECGINNYLDALTAAELSERSFKMKEKYTTPEMDIVEFESEDVITTSVPEVEPQ